MSAVVRAVAASAHIHVNHLRTMMVHTTSDVLPGSQWRPVAYVTMQDSATRDRVLGVLERARWAVIPQPTGFHLIQAIAGMIEGHHRWRDPAMIVVDAQSRGCAGTTIAAGLRDLGITIPIVLVAAPGMALPNSSDPTLRVVDASAAASAVAELADAWPPAPEPHPHAA